MIIFTSQVFAPHGRGPKPVPLLESERARLWVTLKRALFKPQQNPVQILIEAQGHHPLAVSVGKVQHTAGIAIWLRNSVIDQGSVVDGQIEGLTLLLTGINTQADDLAIHKLMRRKDGAGQRFPFPAQFCEKIRAAPRPFAATLCISHAISVEPLFVHSLEALAGTFFDQFPGIGEKREFELLK